MLTLVRKETRITHTGHPAYSPDLSPLDLFLFPPLKSVLKGQRFRSSKEITAELRELWKGYRRMVYKNASKILRTSVKVLHFQNELFWRKICIDVRLSISLKWFNPIHSTGSQFCSISQTIHISLRFFSVTTSFWIVLQNLFKYNFVDNSIQMVPHIFCCIIA
jgi:hypothetical protein